LQFATVLFSHSINYIWCHQIAGVNTAATPSSGHRLESAFPPVLWHWRLGGRKDIRLLKKPRSTNHQRFTSGTGGTGGPEGEPADPSSTG